MWLTNPVWPVTIVLFLAAIIAVILIVKFGQTKHVLTAISSGIAWFVSAKDKPAVFLRHAGVIVLLLTFFFIVKWYASGVAEQKAGDWLRSYNGSATTSVVGAIKADPGLTAPSPTPSATATPTPVPEGTPTGDAQTLGLTTTSSPSPTPGATAGAGANTSESPTPTPTPKPTAAEQTRLDAQLRSIRDRIKHHGDVMAFFYVNYFVAIVMVMAAGLIVAVSLFFVAQKGWTDIDPYVKSIFIVASLTTAFYGLFPPVFQQEKNIIDNKALFLEYKGLESEVESYPVTYLTLKSESKNPREFINHVDAEMDRLGNIALGFDVTKINYQEAITLSKPTPANSASSPTPKPGGK